MILTLHNLKSAKGSRKSKKRVGRGNSSGHGTYSGRGLKGQKARSGGKKGLALKGIRNEIMSIPKVRGFRSIRQKMQIINLSDLEKTFKEESVVNLQSLLKVGLIKNIKPGVKILGKGNLTKKITIENCSFSESAKDAINKAGGSIKENY